MTLSILGLILTQGYWLFKDYKYYKTQPMLSSFRYYIPTSDTNNSGSVGIALTTTGQDPLFTTDTKILTADNTTRTYKAIPFTPPLSQIVHKMKLQFGISGLIVGFTTSCLIYMLATIFRQRKLSNIKNDFINNMTHELKTPLSAVSVAIESLKSFGALSDPVKTQTYLDISKREIDHLSSLIEMLLQQSILGHQKLEASKVPTDISQLLSSVIEKYLVAKSGIHIDLVGQKKLPMISLDPFHIYNAVSNLIDNAIKYTPDTTKSIVLNSQIHQKKWLLSVSDKGIGIPKTYHKEIFSKFFRVPNPVVKEINGFGLGLNYVKQVAEIHGGRISVVSDSNGSTFILEIPLK